MGGKDREQRRPSAASERAPQREDPSSSAIAAHNRPDYVVVLCLVLIYLELSWLILMLLRTYSRH